MKRYSDDHHDGTEALADRLGGHGGKNIASRNRRNTAALLLPETCRTWSDTQELSFSTHEFGWFAGSGYAY